MACLPFLRSCVYLKKRYETRTQRIRGQILLLTYFFNIGVSRGVSCRRGISHAGRLACSTFPQRYS